MRDKNWLPESRTMISKHHQDNYSHEVLHIGYPDHDLKSKVNVTETLRSLPGSLGNVFLGSLCLWYTMHLLQLLYPPQTSQSCICGRDKIPAKFNPFVNQQGI
jgi:hypothetical protein